MSINLPTEFESQMRSRLGDDFALFADALDSPPPVSIRWNPAKSSGVLSATVPWCSSGEYLDQRPVFTLDPRLHAGAYYVQEASSMFLEQAVIQTLDTAGPIRALDLCAAPGGKSTHLLGLLSRESLLVSNDAIRGRMSALRENLLKWGQDNVIITNNDPEDFERFPGFFDLIVVDAPCSGEGLFRKEPEAMKSWSMRGIELCSLRQQRILHHALPALKPGGILIYSTCTYNADENEKNAKWLASLGSLEPVHLKLDPAWHIQEVCEGAYQLYPHRVRGEGFFLSVFRNTGGSMATGKVNEGLKYPSKALAAEFGTWVTHPESKLFFMHGQTVRMIPESAREGMNRALGNLNILSGGTALAEVIREKYVPDHALALSVDVEKTKFNRVNVDKEQALAYLRKDIIATGSVPAGFALVEFEGLGLGWVNILGNRVNNLFPSAYRIRMGR